LKKQGQQQLMALQVRCMPLLQLLQVLALLLLLHCTLQLAALLLLTLTLHP
jgi:hypothetical protein